MVSFSELWKCHPGWGSRPCTYKDQCAVRMGVALAACKVDLSSFTGMRCGHAPKHILRAQELADWIAKKPTLFGEVEVYKRRKLPKISHTDFAGKKGVVFIKDGWGATDHIDLWDGYSMKAGDTSYLSKGTEIWFWRL